MNLFKKVLRKNKKMITLYILLGIVTSFLSVYCIDYFQAVLDSFGDNTLTITMIIIYGVLLLITTVLNYLDTYPEQKLKHGLYLDFKLQALKKMETIDYQEYQKLGTGSISQRVEDGASSSRDLYMDFWFKLFRSLIPSAILSLIFIAKIEIKILLLVFAGYVIVIAVTTIIIRKLYSLKEKILVNSELLNKHLIRGFMELVVFRTNKKYKTEIEITKEGIKNIVDGKTKIRMVHEMFFTIFAMLVDIIKIAIIIYALYTKNITLGGLVAIITLLSKAYEPIAIFNVEFIDYKLNKVAVNRYIDLLSLQDTINLNNGEVVENIKGRIEFKNVDFSYSNKKVLSKLSLVIEPQTRVAFVGETGSGKSTIIKQIVGLLNQDNGEVFVDYHKISDINLNSYYDYLTYLSQESPIFDGTLRENIIFDKNIADEEIEKIIKLVCLENFYKKLPNGLDTELGERGVLISGGERQRIALARLFFDNSKIVILDEATSAMDNITEKQVMNNIYESINDKTFIIIAHRLNTIKNVDNIFVLKDGEILGTGKYNELLEKNEYFKKLATKEAKNNY